jgi:ASTRA-associated protein 1
MAMALAIIQRNSSFMLVSGYESGVAVVWSFGGTSSSQPKQLYRCKSHSQPILSVDINAADGYFLTSGADSVIAKHPISVSDAETETLPLKVIDTKHSGQQSIRLRSDGKIFATAGWDSRVRVYSAKTMNELASLKWHQAGCYAVAFANVDNRHADAGDAAGASGVARFESVRDRRIRQSQSAHWLAAGSKDGKVSLWDIY